MLWPIQLLTKSVALEVAQQNIRINSVVPGPTYSEITGAMPEIPDMFAQIVPIKRMGNREEIANWILCKSNLELDKLITINYAYYFNSFKNFIINSRIKSTIYSVKTNCC